MQREPSKDGLNTSLRCLQYSAVWSSIVILSLNDHLLKPRPPQG